MVDSCPFSNLPLLNHVFFLMFKWLSIKMENIRWLVMCSKCHLLFDIFLACTCLKYVSTVEESVVCGPPTKKQCVIKISPTQGSKPQVCQQLSQTSLAVQILTPPWSLTQSNQESCMKCATNSARQVETECGRKKKTPSVPTAKPPTQTNLAAKSVTPALSPTQPSQAAQSFNSLATDDKATPKCTTSSVR